MAIHKVPVKGGGMLEVDSKDMPDNVYNSIFAAGLKDHINRGMTKIGPLKIDATKGVTEETVAKSAAAALVIAEKNLTNLKAGKVPRQVGVKASDGKISGVVMTEARRLAKNLIKDEIKKAGGKISHYAAKDITEAANAFLASEDGKAMLTQAQANVDARSAAVEAKPAPASLDELQAKLGISVSADKVAKAEKEKAKKAEQKAAGGNVLSAAKAGTLKTRSKGAPAGATVN